MNAELIPFHLKPQEIVFVGDSGIDIKTALNAGNIAVGVLWGYRTVKELKENGAQLLLKKPADLLSLIN